MAGLALRLNTIPSEISNSPKKNGDPAASLRFWIPFILIETPPFVSRLFNAGWQDKSDHHQRRPTRLRFGHQRFTMPTSSKQHLQRALLSKSFRSDGTRS